MAANTNPIFTKTPHIESSATNPIASAMTAANISGYNGTDANAYLCFTATTEGSFIQRARLKCCAITGTSTASVMRFWLNNGSDHTSAGNNSYIGEVSLPAVAYIITAGTVEIDYPFNFAIPGGYKIYAGIATAVTSGWSCMIIGSDY